MRGFEIMHNRLGSFGLVTVKFKEFWINLRDRKSGFTLAEVLIALAVVGIIAVLVLPVVTTRAQNKVFETAYETQVKNLLNSLQALPIVENSTSIDGTMMFTNNANLEDFASTSGTYIQKYMKVSKYCGNTPEGCFAGNYTEFKNNTKSVYSTSNIKGACAVLKNGVSICLRPAQRDENGNGFVSGYFDLNGKKGPNVYGRDLRSFLIDIDDATVYNAENPDQVITLDNSTIEKPQDCEDEGGICTPEILPEQCAGNPENAICCNATNHPTLSGLDDKCCKFRSSDPVCNPCSDLYADTRPESCVKTCDEEFKPECCSQDGFEHPQCCSNAEYSSAHSNYCCGINPASLECCLKDTQSIKSDSKCCTILAANKLNNAEAANVYNTKCVDVCTTDPESENCCKWKRDNGQLKISGVSDGCCKYSFNRDNKYCCKWNYDEAWGNVAQESSQDNNLEQAAAYHCCTNSAGSGDTSRGGRKAGCCNNFEFASKSGNVEFCCQNGSNSRKKSKLCCKYRNVSTIQNTLDKCCADYDGNTEVMSGGKKKTTSKCCSKSSTSETCCQAATDLTQQKACCRAHGNKYNYCCAAGKNGIDINGNTFARCCTSASPSDEYCCLNDEYSSVRRQSLANTFNSETCSNQCMGFINPNNECGCINNPTSSAKCCVTRWNEDIKTNPWNLKVCCEHPYSELKAAAPSFTESEYQSGCCSKNEIPEKGNQACCKYYAEGKDNATLKRSAEFRNACCGTSFNDNTDIVKSICSPTVATDSVTCSAGQLPLYAYQGQIQVINKADGIYLKYTLNDPPSNIDSFKFKGQVVDDVANVLPVNVMAINVPYIFVNNEITYLNDILIYANTPEVKIYDNTNATVQPYVHLRRYDPHNEESYKVVATYRLFGSTSVSGGPLCVNNCTSVGNWTDSCCNGDRYAPYTNAQKNIYKEKCDPCNTSETFSLANGCCTFPAPENNPWWNGACCTQDANTWSNGSVNNISQCCSYHVNGNNFKNSVDNNLKSTWRSQCCTIDDKYRYDKGNSANPGTASFGCCEWRLDNNRFTQGSSGYNPTNRNTADTCCTGEAFSSTHSGWTGNKTYSDNYKKAVCCTLNDSNGTGANAEGCCQARYDYKRQWNQQSQEDFTTCCQNEQFKANHSAVGDVCYEYNPCENLQNAENRIACCTQTNWGNGSYASKAGLTESEFSSVCCGLDVINSNSITPEAQKNMALKCCDKNKAQMKLRSHAGSDSEGTRENWANTCCTLSKTNANGQDIDEFRYIELNDKMEVNALGPYYPSTKNKVCCPYLEDNHNGSDQKYFLLKPSIYQQCHGKACDVSYDNNQYIPKQGEVQSACTFVTPPADECNKLTITCRLNEDDNQAKCRVNHERGGNYPVTSIDVGGQSISNLSNGDSFEISKEGLFGDMEVYENSSSSPTTIVEYDATQISGNNWFVAYNYGNDGGHNYLDKTFTYYNNADKCDIKATSEDNACSYSHLEGLLSQNGSNSTYTHACCDYKYIDKWNVANGHKGGGAFDKKAFFDRCVPYFNVYIADKIYDKCVPDKVCSYKNIQYHGSNKMAITNEASCNFAHSKVPRDVCNYGPEGVSGVGHSSCVIDYNTINEYNFAEKVGYDHAYMNDKCADPNIEFISGPNVSKDDFQDKIRFIMYNLIGSDGTSSKVYDDNPILDGILQGLCYNKNKLTKSSLSCAYISLGSFIETIAGGGTTGSANYSLLSELVSNNRAFFGLKSSNGAPPDLNSMVKPVLSMLSIFGQELDYYSVNGKKADCFMVLPGPGNNFAMCLNSKKDENYYQGFEEDCIAECNTVGIFGVNYKYSDGKTIMNPAAVQQMCHGDENSCYVVSTTYAGAVHPDCTQCVKKGCWDIGIQPLQEAYFPRVQNSTNSYYTSMYWVPGTADVESYYRDRMFNYYDDINRKYYYNYWCGNPNVVPQK